MFIKTLIIVSIFIITSYGVCSSAKPIEGKIFESYKNLSLPKSMIKTIETLYLESFKTKDTVRVREQSDAEILVKLKRKSLKTTIRFVPVDKAPLSDPIRFNLPLGGGVIQLGEHINSKVSGRFKVFFDISLGEKVSVDVEDFKKNMRVYFLGNSKKRYIKKIKLGSGCYSYHDVTQFFNKTVHAEGLLVDSENLSHVSTLAGQFVFVFPNLEDLHLAVIKFTDSQNRNLLCRI